MLKQTFSFVKGFVYGVNTLIIYVRVYEEGIFTLLPAKASISQECEDRSFLL